MNIIWQIGLITGICFAGEGISLLLPASFPPGVLSMILLFVILYIKWIKPSQLRQSTDVLTKNMTFLFVPSGVGVMQVFDEIRHSLLPLFFICIVTTIITFAATATAVKAAIKLQHRIVSGGGRQK